MSFGIIDGVATLSFDTIGTVAIALWILLLGAKLKKHVKFFRTYCIPAPVIGGTLYALVNLCLHLSGVLTIKLTNTYQTDLQNLFFVCVAFSLSLSLLKKGGPRLIKYATCTIILIILQGVVGVFASEAVGLPGAFGVVLGPAPLAGGHGNVAAYGQFLEDAGFTGTMTAGVAAACFGLVTGSFFGGPLARGLIKKYKLVNTSQSAKELEVNATEKGITVQEVFYHLAILAVALAVGGFLGKIVAQKVGISIPTFTGGMILGLIFRFVDDKTGLLKLNDQILEKIQSFTLSIFLSMAMISLNLWQLSELAVPMMIVLALELAMTLVFIRFAVFPICGKDFDSATMCAGLCGHGLGATPNGLANMDSITEEYGYSAVPYLSVTVTGGIIASWTLVAVNTFMVNMFI